MNDTVCSFDSNRWSAQQKPQHAFMQTSINTKSPYKNGPLKPIQILCCDQKFAVSQLLHLIAGGHVNPAVSLAMVVLGKLPLKKFPVYVAAQFLGAFAGSCAVFCLYYGKFSGHFCFLLPVNWLLLYIRQTS